MLVMKFRLLFVTTKASSNKKNPATQKSYCSIFTISCFRSMKPKRQLEHHKCNAPLRVLLGQMEGIYVILTWSQ